MKYFDVCRLFKWCNKKAYVFSVFSKIVIIKNWGEGTKGIFLKFLSQEYGEELRISNFIPFGCVALVVGFAVAFQVPFSECGLCPTQEQAAINNTYVTEIQQVGASPRGQSPHLT